MVDTVRSSPSGKEVPVSGGGIEPPAGQIAGTSTNPLVVGITESSSDDELDIGAISDGQFLRRVGAFIVGVTLAASNVVNDSTVTGVTVTAALNTLNTAIAGFVPTTRTISTTSPLAGGGDLSANRTLTIADLSNTSKGVPPAITAGTAALVSDAGGTTSSWASISGGGSPVGTSRTISTTAPLSGGGDLSANRTLTVAAISNTSSGVAPQTNGTAGQALLATATATTWGTDFQANNLTTSGVYVASSNTHAMSVGTTLPTTGSYRWQHGTTIYGRNNAGSADRLLIDWGVTATDNLHLSNSSTTMVINATTSGIGWIVRLGGTQRLSLSTSQFTNGTRAFAWESTISQPYIQQDTVATNGATGQPTALMGQNASGTTSTGGILDLIPGTGTTAGGLGRLRSSTLSNRVSWNDTGLSFFAVSPIAQQTRAGQLTDSTTGTPSTTLVDVGVAFSQANINNNFSSVLTKYNALETIIHNLGLST